jgi:hypothetical protein
MQNDRVPGFVLRWPTDGGSPPQFGEAPEDRQVLALDGERVAQVDISPRHQWSARFMAPERWLFHVSVAGLPGGRQVAIAANSADGHAAVWISEAAGKPRMAAFVPGALNPLFVRSGATDRLLFRRMPAEWSVYFHDPRYSGRYDPAALPLTAAELGSSGRVSSQRNLSQEENLGDVFAFAAARDGDGLVLAVVAGTKESPELRVYRGDPGNRLELLRRVRIPAVPFRLTVAAGGDAALVGLAFIAGGGAELEGLLVPLR